MCPPSLAEMLRSRVTLELEGIDRMYLNVYSPEVIHRCSQPSSALGARQQ